MPRASWRGHLRLSLVSCPIYLSPATARTKPIRLHQVWQATPAGEAGEPPNQHGEREVTDLRAPRSHSDEVEDRMEPVTRWSCSGNGSAAESDLELARTVSLRAAASNKRSGLMFSFWMTDFSI